MNTDFTVLSVSELNKYISRLLSSDEVLSDVFVQGEISNFKHHSSGHLYFSLKDDDSKLNCVMFKNAAYYLNFHPVDGDSVRVRGRIGVYEKNGNYQVYVNSMEKNGIGELYEQYVKLLTELKDKGYFDKDRKKQIPFLPERIAVITSPTGAAVRDIISVIKRRCLYTTIIVCPVLVQGENASEQISNMIETINNNHVSDLIILARGGGSIEELWAFNELNVANSIYTSDIPIISGVGHETDFTIADFIADMRAPTPSAAAELSVPDLKDVLFTIEGFKTMIIEGAYSSITDRITQLKRIKEKYFSEGMNEHLKRYKNMLDNTFKLMNIKISHKMQMYREKNNYLSKLLDSMSFEKVLKRGFFALEINGELAKADNLKENDKADFVGENKTIKARVENIEMRKVCE